MQLNKHLLILLISLISLSTLAQTSKKTLNYQAVILDPKAIDIPGENITGQPLNKGNICLRFSLINAQGGLDYEETQQVTTDEFGLVNVAIGTGAQANTNNSTSIYKGFDAIQWNSDVKSLKVSVSYDGCNSFKQVSTQALNYSPYALYADAVEYKNVRDSPTKLSQFSNDAGYLIPKDLDPLKADIKTNTSQLATANQTIAENKKSSEASFLIANQSITSLDAKVAENTKAINQNTSSIGTITTKLTDQQNQIFDNRNQISATNNNLTTQIGGLQGQLTVTNSTVSNLSGAAEVVSNKSTAVDLGGANPSDQLYSSQKATKTYVDQNISNLVAGNIPNATTLALGKIQLAGDLGGTATIPTVPALASKENTANKSTSVLADAGDNTKYPSVKAVKDYVDQATLGTALQATVDAKADKNSPTFTGTPILPTGTTAITQTSTDNSTKLATTAFVQQATAGIALQAAVDAKADKNSPTFTGTPVLPTGTTAITQTAGNNTTSLATTAFVQQATAAGTIDASTSLKGKIKLAGDLGGTADSPSVPGLALKANTADVTSSLGGKEDVSNKSTGTALGTSDALYPSQKAVKTYVDAQIASATIADAEATVKGKLKLTGDLGGSADLPTVPGLALKAPLASPTFTGTVAGISKAMVGLGSVDNTTDAAKPVSTSTQTALDAKANATATTDALALKAPLASPLFTGTPTLPTGTTAITQTLGDNTTSLATTAFVQLATAAGTPNATTSDFGKIKLAGDLGGTAALPTIAANAITTSKILDANITYGKIQLVSATDKVLGRITAGSGTVEEISTVGSGNVVRATSPTLVTPALGAASATSLATSAASPFLLTNGQLATIALTSQTVGATTLTIPDFASVADEFTFKTKAQTLSNKTFVAPALGAATGTSLSVSGSLTSTVATGTAPFVVSSTTPVTNLSIGGNAATATSATNVSGTVAVANGGTGSTTAAGARTALDGTTIGQSVFTLTNPSAITFPRYNADNTVSALDAATFRTAIGAGAGGGTVTSVAALTLGTTGTDLSSTVATETTTPVITLNVPSASASNRGVLSAADWSIFNAKQPAGSYATLAGIETLSNKTFVAPILGAASATSINGNTITTGTGTLTLATGKTLTASNTLTFSGTDGSTLNIGAGGTLGSNAYTSTAFAPLASPTFTGTVTMPTPFTLGTTSVTSTGTQLNYLNAATGTTGTASTNVVFSTSPTLVTPVLGAATATSLATSAASPLLLTNGQLATIALTSQTVGATTLTIPDFASVADEFTFKTKSQTLSNKTFVAPALGAATGTSLSVSGSLTSTVATGTAPFVVSSTTPVTNLSIGGNAATATSATNVSGTVAVANGGTGATTLTGILKGNGTSAISGAVSGTDYSLVREVSDEFTVAVDGDSEFTLTQTKSANSKLQMYVNGVHLSKSSFSLSGTTLTYIQASNGNYQLKTGDRIQFEYYY